MATSQKVVTGFNRYRDADLSKKAQYIITSLTGNARFTSPVPALPTLQTALDDFNQGIDKALSGDKVQVAEKNQLRDNLQALLTQLALYVQLMASKDEAALRSSGFDMSKLPAPIGILAKPESFYVAPSNKGSVKTGCDRIYGAKSYQFEYTQTPVTDNSEWTLIADPRANIIINDLESGKEYAFRMTAIGTAPERVYSDEITSFIL